MFNGILSMLKLFVKGLVVYAGYTAAVGIGGVIVQERAHAKGKQCFMANPPQIPRCEYCNKDHCTANSHEGDNKKSVRAIVRSAFKSNFIANQYTQNNIDIENIIKHHFCLITYEVHYQQRVESIMGGVAICVGGDVFVMPRHYWVRIQHYDQIYAERGLESNLRLSWKSDKSTPVYFDNIIIYEPKQDHLKDVIFIKVRHIDCMVNIVKHFVKLSDKPELFDCYLYGIRGLSANGIDKNFECQMSQVHATKFNSAKYRVTEAADKLFGQKLPETWFEVPKSYEYMDISIGKGDCGMVLMHSDAKVTRKLLGFHVASSAATRVGVSCCLYQEDIHDAITYFNKFEPTVMLEEPQMIEQGKVKEQRNYSILESNNFEIEGTLRNYIRDTDGRSVNSAVHLPGKTKISPSIIYDEMEKEYGKATTEPAYLRPVYIANTKISPLENSIKKLTAYSPMVPQREIDSIQEHIYETIVMWNSPYRDNPRLLTDFEMINGFEGLNPIDMSTSPGFPYILNHLPNQKRPYFVSKTVNNIEVFSMGPILQKKYDSMLQKAKQGIVEEFYWVDNLKDETRPIDKSLKPRIFEVGPMHHTLLMRKYLGMFVAHMHSTFLEGESAIGINPNSRDWDIKTQNFLTIANRFLNGDYKWYDSKIAHQIGMILAYIINKFYDDSEENKLIRLVLIAGILTTHHIIELLVFLIRQGNPSGCLVTTILNIIVNMFYIRYGYYHLVDSTFMQFFEHLMPWFYGDDNLIPIHISIQLKFNMITYRNLMETIGVVYTSASKGEIEDELVKFEELSFLKRSFVYDKELHLYIAPLEKNVIMEICRWSMSDPENMEDQMNRFNASLYEMSNYGEKEFNNMLIFFKEMVLLLRRSYYKITTANLFPYHYCRHIMFPEYIPLVSKRKLPALKYDPIMIADMADTNNMGDESDTDVFIRSFTNVYRIIITFIRHRAREIRAAAVVIFYNNPIANRVVDSILLLFTSETSPILPLYLDTTDNNYQYIRNNTFHHYTPSNTLTHRRPRMDQPISYVPGRPIFEANMQASGEENIGDVAKTKGIVSFIDHGEEHDTGTPTTITTFPNYMPHVDLQVFTNRPYILSYYNWSTTDAFKAQIFNIQLPQAIRKYTVFNDKLKNIAFWRPNYELTFRINGTAMHYGKVMFAWYPMSLWLAPTYINFYTAFQQDWVQISANAQQEVKMTIPFAIHQQFLRTQDTTGVYASVVGYVAVPLSCVSASPPPVTITVFGRLVSPNMVGYTHVAYTPDMVVNMDAAPNTEDVQSTPGQTINLQRTVPTFAMFLRNFQRVPILGNFISPIVNAASMTKSILDYLGFAVPHILTPTTPMIIRQPRLYQIEDTTTSTVLAPSQSACVDKNFDYVNGFPGEMSILHFIQRPALLYVGQILSTYTEGQILYGIDLCPRAMVCTDYVSPTVTNPFNPTPLWAMSRHFLQWRGSFRFHIAFTASQFQSCRVRIVYVPYDTTIPTHFDTDKLVSTTLDVTKETEYGFTIPFLQNVEWMQLPVSSTIPAPGQEICMNGYMYIMLINILTSGEPVVNPIYFQIFVSAGTDFQFADPTLQFIRYIGYCYQPSTSDSTKTGPPTNSTTTTTTSATTTMTADMMPTKECQLPSTSMKCLREAEYPIFGGMEKTGHTSTRTNMSLNITSLRQLCNMQSLVYAQALPQATFQSLYLTGYISAGPSSADQDQHCHLAQILPYFRFWRGGIRYVIVCNVPGMSVTVNYATGFASLPLTPVTVEPAPIIPLNYDIQFVPNAHESPADFTLPYMNNDNCYVVTLRNDSADPLVLTNANKNAYVSIINMSSLCTFYVFMGAADDFIMGYQMGIPLMVADPLPDETELLETGKTNTIVPYPISNTISLEPSALPAWANANPVVGRRRRDFMQKLATPPVAIIREDPKQDASK